MAITSKEIDVYHRQGFVLVEGALDPSDTKPVIDELETFIDQRAKELLDEEKITNLHSKVSFDQRYGLLLKQSSEVGYGMDIMHMRKPAMFAFLGNSNLLDTIESLIGPEIVCSPIQHVRAKPPSSHGNSSWSHGVPWHQDAAVMMKEAEGTNAVTCWIPLSQSTVENGCLQIIPNSGKLGYLRHQKEGGTTVVPELMPTEASISLECRRGDIILLNRFIIHSSLPNQSDRCRWSLDLRYQPIGQHTGRTAHPNFVVRSQRHPDHILTNYDQWCHMWTDAFEHPRGHAGHRTD